MVDTDRASIAHRKPPPPILVDDAAVSSLTRRPADAGKSLATGGGTTPARLDRDRRRFRRTGPIEEQDGPQSKPGPESPMRE